MRPPSTLVGGGGIIGLAAAYRLLRHRPGHQVTVLEKEQAVGRHQTGHNSGVLHAGLYYKPGSAKARLDVRGIRQMVAFCEEQGVPCERCGKVVVAADASERPRLDELYARGRANGLTGLRRLVPEVREGDLAPGGAGVRAQAMLPDGDLVQDFYFLERADALHVLNAPSPGATAALAIGDEIVHRLGDRLGGHVAAAARDGRPPRSA